MPKRIFDCFTFFNELDLLEVRLTELFDHVDYFVICESTQTFQGKAKQLFFMENRDRYAKFMAKIIHVVVDDMPDTKNPWEREHFQRNALRRGLVGLDPEDIAVISDLDELVRPSTMHAMREASGYFLIEMPMYQYYLNMWAGPAWNKVYAFSHRLSDQLPDLSTIRVKQIDTFEAFPCDNHRIVDGGWHFTYLGGADKVREKLSSYSHTGGHFEALVEPGAAERHLAAGFAVGGTQLLEWRAIDETFPRTIIDNLQHFKEKGFVKEQAARIRELEQMWRVTDENMRRAEEKYSTVLAQISSLVERTHELARPYAQPEFRGARDAGKNLIAGSTRFTGGWHTGTQGIPEVPVTDIPHVYLDNQVLQHQRGEAEIARDNNMGRYHVDGLIVGARYTASCWIWLPAEFHGEYIMLAVEGTALVRREYANLRLRGRWQRIWTCGQCKADRTDTNIVLRIDTPPGQIFYSTCWQLEAGGVPTAYKPTDC